MTFPEVTSVWGVGAVAILDSSVNCVCVWLTKKLTMLAYCVAANCKNLQMTPGIAMHELPRNWPAVSESGLNLYNSNELTFLLRHIMPICIASTSVSVISHSAWGLLRSWHDVPVLFQNPAWQAQTDTAVSLWVSRAKYQFSLWSSSWPFCSNSPEWRSRHMVTWFGCHGDTFGMTENAFFWCVYNPQITVSPTSSFSVSFNGNHVKNHP